jgi:hypothetical protein
MRKYLPFLLLLLFVFVLSSCSDTGSIGEYQSVPGLYDSCPGECGQPLTCEGQTVNVWGYLDAHNVFEKPGSASEKARFVIAGALDAQGFGQGDVIEVIPPEEQDNQGLFDKLAEIDSSSQLLINGVVAGYDAPTNITCRRLISLAIDGENSVVIK